MVYGGEGKQKMNQLLYADSTFLADSGKKQQNLVNKYVWYVTEGR